jgi:hypothetical protein
MNVDCKGWRAEKIAECGILPGLKRQGRIAEGAAGIIAFGDEERGWIPLLRSPEDGWQNARNRPHSGVIWKIELLQ